MKTKKCAPHILALSAMLVLGNAVISMSVNVLNIYSLIFFGIISFTLIFVAKLLLNLGQKSRTIFYIIVVFTSALALWGAVTTFIDFINFLKFEQLPQANVVLLSAVLVGVVIVFACSSELAFYKYSLLVAIIGSMFVALCFVGGVRNFKLSLSEFIFAAPNFSFTTYAKFFLPVMLLPVFANVKDKPTLPIVLGVAVGFLVLLVCVIQSTLTLGDTSDIAYPYLKAVSVISSGSLFTRLDGFVYFLFFVTALIKITVCIKVIKKAISNKNFIPTE